MAFNEGDPSQSGARRNLATEPLNNCDKCNQPVPESNDALTIDSVVSGNWWGLMIARRRHFLPTDICQGSPSRAQYIEGEPRDQRGYEYSEENEPLYRVAYELVRARYSDDKTLSNYALDVLINNFGRGMRLIKADDERLAEQRRKQDKLGRQLDEAVKNPRSVVEAALSPQTPRRMRKGSAHFTIEVEGQSRQLNQAEYLVLKALADHQPNIVGLRDLRIMVAGESHPSYSAAVYISQVRSKIEPDRKRPTFIQTIAGKGYRFNDPEGKIVFPQTTTKPS